MSTCQDIPIACRGCEVRSKSPICSADGALLGIGNFRIPRKFKSGERIFGTGQTPTGIYVVKSGYVKLGDDSTLRLIGPGSLLGCQNYWDQTNYHASAFAIEDCELCFIPGEILANLIGANSKVAMNLIARLSQKLHAAEERLMNHFQKDARERIAGTVLYLTSKFKNHRWTRKEIAQLTGTTTETVIRVLAQFEKEGLIGQDNRQIKILSEQKLLEIAG